MKKMICFLGAAVYGIVAAYLLWLVFYFLSPWLMSFGWLAVILYVIFALGLIGGLIGWIASLIWAPLLLLLRNSWPISKVIPVIALILFGISAIILPWRMDMGYSLVKIVIAISLSITALITFGSLILYKDNDKG
ncbi:MAG: hypothetical protein LBN29_04010 [Mediterranea sp.]|nr:hypothetical protein [Mediterranea sp.]